MKHWILRLWIIFLWVVPAWSRQTSDIHRGSFGEFRRSLNDKDYGYQVVPDFTGKAPVSFLEKFEVRSGDCGVSAVWSDCKMDRERSELSEKKRDNEEGKALWYGWSLYIPKEYVTIDPAKVALGQFHQDDGEPLWMFQQNKDGLFLEANLLNKNQKYSLLSDEELRGQWHHFEIEVLWAPTEAGYLRLWVDGKQKVDYKGVTKRKNKVYFKYGLYRSFLSRFVGKKKTSAPTQVVYFANVKRAQQRAGLLSEKP